LGSFIDIDFANVIPKTQNPIINRSKYINIGIVYNLFIVFSKYMDGFSLFLFQFCNLKEYSENSLNFFKIDHGKKILSDQQIALKILKQLIGLFNKERFNTVEHIKISLFGNYEIVIAQTILLFIEKMVFIFL